MMNLTPTEADRLIIFTAAELARRNRSLGIKLSHPEAVALLADEIMTAARLDRPYAEIRDMAGRLLTTDDVEPGVAEMIPMLYIECHFAQGTKVMVLFEPISLGSDPLASNLIPGEIISPDEEVEMFAGLPTVTVDVVNTGDRDVQVRSHSHFFEVNRALNFDRAIAWGMKIDRPAGTGIRFEPGVTKAVSLVPIDGDRLVFGFGGLVDGALDAPGAKERGLQLARQRGYLGA
jgi:urease subunit gamma/beta